MAEMTASDAVTPRMPQAPANGERVACQADATVSLGFGLQWRSTLAVHNDWIYAPSLNLWRDSFPDDLLADLVGAFPGDTRAHDYSPGQLLAARDPRDYLSVVASRFNHRYGGQTNLTPHAGRFYPRGVIAGVCGIEPQNTAPMRVVTVGGESLDVDLSHPLVDKSLHLTTCVLDITGSGAQGGVCTEVAEWLTAGGPGMQSRYPGIVTDFWSPDAFARDDTADDSEFYGTPRLVNHIDSTASSQVAAVYRQLIAPGARVLDLMSSWQSHLDADMAPGELTGLGLNAAELQANKCLTRSLVHDLNQSPQMPLDTECFDAVICTASVEYLIDPVAVFRDVARVLRPGGVFIVTFSNRWFPPKAINLWSQLHEFERPALVLEYFFRSDAFERMHSWSVRGLPRPVDDKYAARLKFSDPVHAVWAYRH